MSALKTLVDFVCKYAGSRSVEIHYSDITQKYYCSVPFEIKEGCCLRGVCCHADNIEKSAEETLRDIKGKLLVFNAMTESRKEVYFHVEESR